MNQSVGADSEKNKQNYPNRSQDGSVNYEHDP
jgi:hypothetical protein